MKKIFFLAPLVFSLITGFISGYAYQLYLGREECLKAAFPEASYDLSPEEIENITRALNSEADEQKPASGQKTISNEEESQKSGPYVGSKNSNKIYPVDCRYAKLIKEENKVFFGTAEEGEKQGKIYVKCK